MGFSDIPYVYPLTPKEARPPSPALEQQALFSNLIYTQITINSHTMEGLEKSRWTPVH